MIYVGLDPGYTGAVAVIRDTGEFVEVFDPPTVQVVTGKKTAKGNQQKKTQYVPGSMVDILRGIQARAVAKGEAVHLAIEKTWAMLKPGEDNQSAVAVFNTGYGYGLWKGIIAALGIPYEEVPPNTWKMAMVGRKPADEQDSKSRSILRAQELFPAAAPFLKRKMDDGRAEAILIAEWSRRNAMGMKAMDKVFIPPPVNKPSTLFDAFGDF